MNNTSMPTGNGAGCTRWPYPDTTGLAMTHSVSETATANNRILENESGVTLGDVNGDGWCDLCALFEEISATLNHRHSPPASTTCSWPGAANGWFSETTDRDGGLKTHPVCSSREPLPDHCPLR